jgi:hypothetical protein
MIEPSESSHPLSRVFRRLAEVWCRPTDGRRATFLGFFCALMFLAVNWRHYHQDVVPLAFAPVSIWRYGTVNLDAFRPWLDRRAAGEHWPWTESNGHLYSEKSVFVSLLVAPWYLPPVLAGVPTENYDFWIAWGRIAAGMLTGLTVALVYLTLRRYGDVIPATAFALLFAFGTCVWTIIGHTLYDHQAILFVALVVLLLHDFPLSPGGAFAAALAAGASVVLRPVTVVLLFPVGLYLLLPGRLAGWRGYLAAVAGILPFPLLMALANTLMFGNWYSTGYPPSQYRDSWKTPWLEGAVGLLIAPNSGLLIQCPFFLLAILGTWVAWTSPDDVKDAGLLRTYGICFVPYWALFAKWHDWQGGLTFTTRMLSEGYPLWMPLCLVGWNRLRNLRLVVPASLMIGIGIWSVLYQLVNLSTFDRTSELNTIHLPWTVQDHFFVVHLRYFGIEATVRSVAVNLVLFLGCATFVAVSLWFCILRTSKDSPVTEMKSSTS